MSKDKTERRFIVADELEIRADKDGNPTRITGYAAVFNKLSEDLGGFREKIKRGAFTDTVKEDDVRMLWNHDSNFVLGRSSAGTLKLEENSKGLKVTNKPPNTQWARDLMVSIGRGDVSQMSFGFRTLKDEWDEEDEDDVVRTLVKVKLLDVSPVSYPAYPQTSVATRAFESWKEERKLAEDEKAGALKEKKERKLRAIKRKHAIRRKELDNSR